MAAFMSSKFYDYDYVLEAVRVIAMCEPSLFRRMVKFSCLHFEEAKAYYHVSGRVRNVPDVDAIDDTELPEILDLPDARQVLHITYGLLLQMQDEDGECSFRNEIYDALRKHELLLTAVITAHIKRHLHDLGILPAPLIPSQPCR